MSRAGRLLVLSLVALVMAACGGGGDGGDATAGGDGGGAEVTLDPANATQDNAARSLLTKALRAANTHYYDGGDSYEGFDAAAAAEIDGSITWLDATEPAVGEVSITDALENHVHLVTRSESGLFFCLRNLNQFGRGEYLTGYGASFDDVNESGECIGERD